MPILNTATNLRLGNQDVKTAYQGFRPIWSRIKTPTQVTGLQCWYDSSDLATITDAGGGKVSQWNDKSGNARHQVQATDANRPITGTRTINGRNVLSFADNTRMATSTTFTIPQPLTMVGLVASDMNSTAQRYLFGNGLVSGNIVSVQVNVNNWRMAANTALGGTGTTRESTLPKCFVALFNGTSSTLHVDGVLVISGNAGTFGFVNQNIWVSIGSTTATWHGTIGELMLYNRALTLDEQRGLEVYLMTKWQPTPPVPLSIPGYLLWYDASDLSSITVTGIGVSQWNDKTGYARHATQGTDANRPLTGTRTLNGLNVLDFDPVAQSNVNTATFTVAHPLTIAAVAQSDSVGARNIIGGSGASPLLTHTTTNWQMNAGASLLGTPRDNNPHSFIASFNTLWSTLYLDGAVNASGNSGTNGRSAAAFIIGKASTGGAWDGAIAEVIVYDRMLAAAEREQLVNYFRQKWGTP